MVSARCSECGSTAVYREGGRRRGLCARCLSKALEGKVRRYLARRGDLTPSERVLVALIGGTKSLVCLDLLLRVERRWPSARVAALAVRRAGEEKNAGVVELAAEEVGAEVVGCAEVGGDWGLSSALEVCLRAAAQLRFTSLAVPLTLDDCVVMWTASFLRGAGYGLPWRVGEVKVLLPLARVSLKEALAYALVRGLPMVRPSGGLGRVEEVVAGLMYDLEAGNPGLKFGLVSSLERLRELRGAAERPPGSTPIHGGALDSQLRPGGPRTPPSALRAAPFRA